MLTMSQPIKLNTLRRITKAAPDGESCSFSQRIMQNYALIDMRFSAEDLFFLVNTPPDIPEFANPMTSLIFEENINASRDFSLNILNNVVNRILLSGDNKMTYQDEVYISSVLNKLGITDTSFFMRQVNQLRNDNVQTYNLLKLYQENLPMLKQMLKSSEETKDGEAVEKHYEETASQLRYTLHNEIFKRLQTAEITNIMQNHINNTSEHDTYISPAQLHTAEHRRISNQLLLSELRQSFSETDYSELQHIHINAYESGEDLPPVQTEREVVERSTAGVLLNIIDNAVITQMQSVHKNQANWFDITEAVYSSAAQSLERFQTFHTYKTAFSVSDKAVDTIIKDLSKKEEVILSKIVYGEHEPAWAVPAEIQLLTEQVEHYESQTEINQTQLNSEYVKLIRDINRERIETQTLNSKEAKSVEQVIQNRQTVVEKLERELSTVKEQLTQAQPQSVKDITIKHSQLVNAIKSEQNLITAIKSVSVEDVENINKQSTNVHQIISTSARQIERQLIQNEINNIANIMQSEGDYSADITHLQSDYDIDESVIEEQNYLQTEAAIKTQLDEYDKQNRQAAAALMQAIDTHSRPESNKPDPEKVMRDSLRALENPEQVFSEIFNEGATLEHKPVLLPEEEMALSVADETSRRIFEEIVKSRQSGVVNTELNIEKQIQTFNNEITQLRQSEITELTHLEQLTEETQTVINEIGKIAAPQLLSQREQSIRQRQGVFTEPVKTVHKINEQFSFPDEVIEKLSQQTQEKHERINVETGVHKSYTENEINNIIKEHTAKSTEDITELVNSTISKQLGTISEKVYTSMERKLTLERARRGK
ncbi:MAG: hypothetical protein FWD34_01160 [Oscillospiraceae bacterium]|nr:hypothetical protein [Oscillospiraceae bacterium]